MLPDCAYLPRTPMQIIVCSEAKRILKLKVWRIFFLSKFQKTVKVQDVYFCQIKKQMKKMVYRSYKIWKISLRNKNTCVDIPITSLCSKFATVLIISTNVLVLGFQLFVIFWCILLKMALPFPSSSISRAGYKRSFQGDW